MCKRRLLELAVRGNRAASDFAISISCYHVLWLSTHKDEFLFAEYFECIRHKTYPINPYQYRIRMFIERFAVAMAMIISDKLNNYYRHNNDLEVSIEATS